LRLYKQSKNIIKLRSKDRTIFVAYKDFNLIDAGYLKEMLIPEIITQPKNYIILTGISYTIKILCFDDLHCLLDGCCGVFGLGLKKEDVLKYIH